MIWIQTLITENPMMIEITRFRRKFFGGSGNALNGIIVAICVLIYIGLVALVWNNRDSANPMILVFLQTGIVTFLGPAMLHSAIAGERERRSWDFLLVAPVTQAQIVAGKFAGAAVAILFCFGAFLLPIGMGAVAYEPYSYAYTSGPGDSARVDYWVLFQAELMSLTWAFFVCALTIFFSARCRRGFIALGTTLAMLVVGLIVWPLLTSAAQNFRNEMNFLNFFHPFWALSMLENNRFEDHSSWAGLYGFPQIISYSILTVFFLIWTERTVRFADTEVKFLPKQKDA